MKRKTLLPLSLVLILSSCGFLGGNSISSSSNNNTSNNDSSVLSSSEINTESSEIIYSSEISNLPVTTGICAFAPSKYKKVWAWTEDKKGIHNLFSSWPGAEVSTYDEDWVYYNFNDYDSLWVIFSYDDTHKTADAELTSPGYWWFKNGSWVKEIPTPVVTESSSSSEEIIIGDSEEDSSQATITPAPLSAIDSTHRTWYQLLVYSFADGNNDGVGDFKGLIQHLDYLKDLGIGGIWLSPCHPSADYHGYDVKDYYSIDSKYEVGDYNFDRLLTECHNRDIHVLMDMVVNHTSSQHPWTWEHPDWYSGEHVFSGSMPDLNYDNQAVRTEIKKIGKYWLDKGVDGFRCDGAAWIYGGGNNWTIESDKFAKTIEWWTEYASYLKSVKSDVYIVGEVWTDLKYVEQFYSTGMSAFNFSASYWAKDALNDNNASKWVEECVSHQTNVRKNNINGVEASFLSNHDTGRFASDINSKNKLMLANALNVISPGGSFIYYGDELGMTGSAGGWTDQGYRTPMPFSSGRTNGNSYMYRDASSNTLSGKSAEEDALDSDSMYSSLKSVIHFKNDNAALYNAPVSQISYSSNKVGIMKYDTNDEDYYLVLNSSSSEQEVSVSGSFTAAFKFESNGKVTISNSSITLPAYSFTIIKASSKLSFAK